MEADGDVYVLVSQHNDIMISDVDEKWSNMHMCDPIDLKLIDYICYNAAFFRFYPVIQACLTGYFLRQINQWFGYLIAVITPEFHFVK